MRKKVLSVSLILILVFALTGCGSKESDADAAVSSAGPQAEDTEKPAENLSGTVIITGSTSVDKILNDMADEFMALNPDVDIKYTGSGSSAGIEDTIKGVNTIGASSRELTEEEKESGIVPEVFAYDGIALIVNPANGVSDISIEQLAKIYSGQIVNWKELGGKDSEIVPVSREGASGTRSAFEELIGLEAAGGLVQSALVVEGNGNVQTTVAGNENAIGYVSFSFLDETVKALTVDGKEATAENAKSGEYPLSRPFQFVYSGETITPEGKAFIEYAKSPEAQAFVEEHGGIRVDQ